MTFKTAFIAIFTVVVVHAVLIEMRAYDHIPRVDIPMHIAGGFVMGLLGLALHTHAEKKRAPMCAPPAWYVFFFIVGFSLFTGVLWEFYEYVFDQTASIRFDLPPSQSSNSDTMGDFLSDLLGASGAFLLFFRKKRIVLPS